MTELSDVFLFFQSARIETALICVGQRDLYETIRQRRGLFTARLLREQKKVNYSLLMLKQAGLE